MILAWLEFAFGKMRKLKRSYRYLLLMYPCCLLNTRIWIIIIGQSIQVFYIGNTSMLSKLEYYLFFGLASLWDKPFFGSWSAFARFRDAAAAASAVASTGMRLEVKSGLEWNGFTVDEVLFVFGFKSALWIELSPKFCFWKNWHSSRCKYPSWHFELHIGNPHAVHL